MARRVSWTNNSTGHTGTYVYRAPTLDPQNLPAPVATVDPVAQGETAEWTDSEALAVGDYDYAVQDFDESGVSALSSLVTYNAPPDLSTAQAGDEIGGGIYAGIDTIDGVDYYIVMGKAASEAATGIDWNVVEGTVTPGTESVTDGLANTQAMQAAGIANHPAAQHCVNYTGGGFADWHMPAISQLRLIYANIPNHPELADNVAAETLTWASTQEAANPDFAWVIRFSNGFEATGGKVSDNVRARPVRRVAV